MKIEAIPFVPGCNYGKICYWWENESNLSDKVIVLRDTSIRTIASIKVNKPAAILVVGCHRFSHILIYLYSLGIPTVLIDPLDQLEDNFWIFVNGTEGFLFISPDIQPPKSWKLMLDKYSDLKFTDSVIDGTVLTKDCCPIQIEASVSNIKAAKEAIDLGITNIGLTRTEFFFEEMHSKPTIEDHKVIIQELLNDAKLKNISIRLLDFGGGKLFDWLPNEDFLKDSLGIRGCRAFKHPELKDLLITQLKAISYFSNYKNLSILVPFISNTDEFIEVQRFIISIIGDKIPINAMVETPSSVFSLPELCNICSKISIGTNDMMQCFYGASREIPFVADQLLPYSQALLRFFEYIAIQQEKTKKTFKICGHLPLLPNLLEAFIGLGFQTFSIEPSFVGLISNRISKISLDECKIHCKIAISALTQNEFLKALTIT